MTLEIALVLAILMVAMLLFVTEWVRMDLVALMALSALALTGLVSPAGALAGFSNPAVITVWAMFILSEGLTRAGIADLIGRNVMRAAGRNEARMIAILMIVAGVLSGFMNNIAVATLMLPVAVDVARRSAIAPSRLLMPLAYGTLLGGMTTLIGTPPNLLVSVALRDAGLAAFRFFDFVPVGLPILLAGTAFVALLGRHLLPRTDPMGQLGGQRNLRAQYGLQDRIFALRVPVRSLLAGKSITEAGLTSAAGLLIIALIREGRTQALPNEHTALRGGDILLAQGRLDRFNLLRQWSELSIERESPIVQHRLWEQTALHELVVADDSALVGEPLRHREFRERYGANVLAIRRAAQVRRTRLAEMVIAPGDRLLVQCAGEALDGLRRSPEFGAVAKVTDGDLRETYHLEERLFVLRVPRDSALADTTIGENRLGDAFDFRLLAVLRKGKLIDSPSSEEVVEGGDLLMIQGREEDLDVLRGLQQLEILEDVAPYLGVFEHGHLELIEATLHPRAELAGKHVTELKLSERYQVELAAIWRDGKPHRSGLDAMTLQVGDAFLIVGPRRKLAALNRDPNLIVLNPVHVPTMDTSKAPLAGGLLVLVVGSVLVGFLPIAIAAVVGATLMVVTRCLSMDQAYRAIDWRSIFLIAGMLPLAIAMQETGAAVYLAGGVLALLGPYGPWPVIAGLYAVTVLGTVIIPTAALVLIMIPIALAASAELAVSPHAAMMAVAIAATASFASPVSHPANVLVMGPGGYRFVDYLRLGVPLALVAFVVTALLLPVFWPLR